MANQYLIDATEGAPNPTDSARTFGAWVTERRTACRLSVRGLAARAEVSHASISKIEDSLVGASREMVLKIADALGADRTDAITTWLADPTQDGGAVELTYEPDPDSIPIPEGYNDDDPMIRTTAMAAAQRTYLEVVGVMRAARRRSSGTVGFAVGRYDEWREPENEGTSGGNSGSDNGKD